MRGTSDYIEKPISPLSSHMTIDMAYGERQQQKFLKILWLGFLIYSAGLIIPSTGILSVKMGQAIQLPGLLLFVLGIIKVFHFEIPSNYLKATFVLYCIWLFSVVIRGLTIPFNYDFIKEFLFGGGLLYITPVALLLPRNFAALKILFQAILVYGIFYLFCDVIFIRQLLVPGQDLLSQSLVEGLTEISLPVGFILFTHIYHSTKKNLIAVAILGATLLFAVIRARRGLIFISGSIIFVSYFIYLFTSRRFVLMIYFSILAVLLGSLYAANLYKINNHRIFSFLADRGAEDTRTGVELYFYADMEPNDWAFGKGMNGTYYCPNVQVDQPSDYRNGIETGYLQIILNGGIVSLTLLFLIIVPAIILGLFFSRNLLSKAAAMWIFLFITNLYPQNAVAFDLSYLLVWICVGLCYTRAVRKMRDSEIYEQLNYE